MVVAAFVTFFSFLLVLNHLPSHWMRRLVGYCGFVDIVLHVSIIALFLGTSTQGLLQAEAAGICFSLYLRGYRYLMGYERLEGLKWMRYSGKLTRAEAA